MALTPEGRVKAAVKKVLKDLGAWFFCPVSNGMGVHGIPDFIVCWQGRFIGIECKAPGKENTVTPHQHKQIELIHRAGGIAVVVSSAEQLENILVDRF